MGDRLELLQCLRDIIVRMRKIATDYPSTITPRLLRLASEIAADSTQLEGELTEEGIILKPPAGAVAYSLYFLDDGNAIKARHEFHAADDGDAATIAALLSDACSDVCPGYELWKSSRVIASTRDGVGTRSKAPTLDEIGEWRQRNLLLMEETLHRSRWHLAQSRKLLEVTETLRQRRN